jgi:hypothetical protein
MTRQPNENPRVPVHFTVHFHWHEIERLKRYKPGGGYQDLMNWLVDNIDESGLCHMSDEIMGRTIRYCMRYGDGGPNNRIRQACVPALKRIGITIAE